jgi:hypothetical protein
MRRTDAIREELKRQPDEQLSETDPDSHSMISQAMFESPVGLMSPATLQKAGRL